MKKRKKNWFEDYNKNQLSTNSWFDINIINNENFVNNTNNIKPINKFLKCKIIKIEPNNIQKDILLKWMDSFIDMYNSTNYFINNHLYNFNERKVINENKKEYLNFRNLRSKYLKNIKDNYCVNKINKHILDQSIDHCVSKHKSSITNFFNGNNNFFRLRNMKKNRRKKILILESGLFSKKKNGFCISVLKEIKSSIPLDFITKTSILQYDKHLRQFNLYVPIEDNSINLENRTKCGIDPGIRTFLTCYSENKILEIGNNCYEKYKKYYEKIDKINNLYITKKLNKQKQSKALNKNHDKIKNLTKDLHYKSCKLLTSYFDNIQIGKISTRSIVSNEKNLNKISKRAMLSLSHFLFRERLQFQSLKRNVSFKCVNEYNTSKMCSSCKNLYNVGQSKLYCCSNCNLIIDRDINASINIYNK